MGGGGGGGGGAAPPPPIIALIAKATCVQTSGCGVSEPDLQEQ